MLFSLVYNGLFIKIKRKTNRSFTSLFLLKCLCFDVLQLEMAEDCLKNAMDLSGLLLLYSSLGDAEGVSKLASLAKEHGKNNVAFLCLFLLGKLEECLQLLVDRCFFFSFLLLLRRDVMVSTCFDSILIAIFLHQSDTRGCFNGTFLSSKQRSRDS